MALLASPDVGVHRAALLKTVLVNGARGTRDIEGKVTRVGASELGCERVSRPRGNIRLAVAEIALATSRLPAKRPHFLILNFSF